MASDKNTKGIWTWLTSEGNVRALGVLGAVIVALAGSGWTVFLFLDERSLNEETTKLEAFNAFQEIANSVGGSKFHVEKSGSPCHLNFRGVPLTGTGWRQISSIIVAESDLMIADSRMLILHSGARGYTIWVDPNPEILANVLPAWGKLKTACVL